MGCKRFRCWPILCRKTIGGSNFPQNSTAFGVRAFNLKVIYVTDIRLEGKIRVQMKTSPHAPDRVGLQLADMGIVRPNTSPVWVDLYRLSRYGWGHERGDNNSHNK